MNRLSMFLVALGALLWLIGFGPAEAGDGSSCANPPPSLDQVLGTRTIVGALVIRVEPDSPAAAAGIALCDFLERASGEDLRQVGSLEAFTARMREAAMLAHAPLAVRKYDAVTESYSPGAVDLRLPAEVGAKAGMSLSTQILVLEVAPDSPAAQAGIEPGDFIESVNGERVPDIRSPTLIDQRVSDAALNDGVVTLTVGRWRPVPDSPEQKLAFSSRREVTVAVGSAVGG